MKEVLDRYLTEHDRITVDGRNAGSSTECQNTLVGGNSVTHNLEDVAVVKNMNGKVVNPFGSDQISNAL
ncbi:hypothetical protein FRX31_005258 [Thalictrum thalictroides]|uniref:Uncharacterized protein n=1 Tax=Thalictrum thalictroides TaxID=46969 RepID=A0A7J6X8G5_THATH|nr:hypothetical protein FRX31_005258 [Thalictrum thalictroides]